MPDDPELEGEQGGDPVAEAVAAVDAQLDLTPEAIRATPEFRALETQLRASARREGSAKKAAGKARTEAETYRQAAEAQRAAALDAEISSLPEAAVAAYEELAELGQTDPVAAARRLAELLTSAQSAQAPAAGEAAPTAAPTEVPVSGGNPSVPPPMSAGADGNVPLNTPPGEDLDTKTARLDDRYAAVVARNQDPVTRNRVTMRERADGLISYLASAYIKAVGHD